MASESHLPQIDVSADRPSRPDAVGWLTSLCLHLLLLLIIALLVAPADLSGVRALVISLSSSDAESESGELTLCSIELPDSDAEQSTPPPVSLAATVVSDFIKMTANTNSVGGLGNGSAGGSVGGGAPGGDTSLRGSFFGIEAYGHEFVYVVDMSGSMEGQLYHRAIAELIRSIDRLNPSQKFYVTLFSNHTKTMFNDTSLIPKPIPATDENRERLAEWLTHAFDGGGTDPRRAVKLALDMNPSAIFMLSDGQFKEKKQNHTTPFEASTTTTTSKVVRSVNASIPIHSIAFENKKSCESMEELAELTGGVYRFVPVDDQTVSLDDAIVAIEFAIENEQSGVAQLLFNELLYSLDIKKLGENQRRRLGEMMTCLSERALRVGGAKQLAGTLKSLLDMDPDGIVSFDDQIKLVEAIQKTADATSDSLLAQSDLLRRYGSSRLCQEMQRKMMQQLSDELDRSPSATELDTPTEIADAFDLFRGVGNFPGGDELKKGILERQRQIVSHQIGIAAEKEVQGGTIAFVTHLLDAFASTDRNWLKLGGEDAIRLASMRMQAQLRDGVSGQNVGIRLQLKQEIQQACRRSPEFGRASAEFVRNDRMATGLYHSARREELKGNQRVAIANYEAIVEKHPYARVIDSVRTRLAALTGEPVKDTEERNAHVQTESSFFDLYDQMVSNEDTPSESATQAEADSTPDRNEFVDEVRMAEPGPENVYKNSIEHLLEALR